jgi:hypothetical protein
MFVARPGLRHIVTLLPHFRLGVFTSVPQDRMRARVRQIEDYLWRDCGLAVRLVFLWLSSGCGCVCL